MSHVRAAVMTHFAEVARSLKIDSSRLLYSAGVDASLLDDPERMLPTSAVSKALEAAARQSGCEHFGLLMAERRSLGSLGPISLALVHEPQVGGIVRAMVRHQHLFGDAFNIEATTIGEETFVRIEPAGSELFRQAAELAVALFCRCIATILRRHWSPECIHFIHSAPHDLRTHRRVFMSPIVFDSDQTAIVFSREDLQEPNPSGDAELAFHAETLLALMMPPAAARTAADKVRRSLRLLLTEHRGTLEDVAQELGLTPRSLQRQLDREGHSFGALLNKVRRELALQYLTARRSVTEVALIVGYHSASSFTRWFKSEFGMSPLDWRNAANAMAKDGPTDVLARSASRVRVTRLK